MLTLLGGSASYTRADGEIITGDVSAPTGDRTTFQTND
jgi:hypothetical protein